MYDVLTIAAIVDEFNTDLINGRIQQVLQVDQHTIALEVYAQRQRRWLVASTHPELARVILTSSRVDSDPDRTTPLLLLLRKYARGGRIVSVSQPRYERVIQVSIAKPIYADNAGADDRDVQEPAELACTDLYVELMGRRSNIILAGDEGRILDAIKRVTPEMSRVRPIRPGMTYQPPPPQQKADPLRTTPQSLHARLRDRTEPLARGLVSSYLGVSPLLAREIAFRAGVSDEAPSGSLTDDDAEAVTGAMREVFLPLESGIWQPVLYTSESDDATFAAIRLRSIEHRPGVIIKTFDSMSAAAEAAWNVSISRTSASPQRHAARRERLIAEIDEAHTRIDNRLRSLNEQAARAAEAESLRQMGEMIYAYLANIQPGQTELRTPDGLTIALDPDLTPSQNAQEYFERYRKARSAEENLPELIERTRHELTYLNQLRVMAQLSETYDEIESVRLEWVEFADETAGIPRASRARGARPARSARRPRTWRTMRGDSILVGRTGQQNEMVTFEIAGPSDLWLHARNMPGAHVILRSVGPVTEEIIERAAALAAWYSDGRHSTAVPVDVTERRHVRKIKGAGPGMVTYRNERTLNVRPSSERELGLEPVNS